MNLMQPGQSRKVTSMGKVALGDYSKILEGRQRPKKLATMSRLRSTRALYGLPCAKCRAYYDANQSQCPICNAKERLSPNAFSAVKGVYDPGAEQCGDYAALEAERESFLRDFKARISAAQMQTSSAAELR
jgi:hypothetical protein